MDEKPEKGDTGDTSERQKLFKGFVASQSFLAAADHSDLGQTKEPQDTLKRSDDMEKPAPTDPAEKEEPVVEAESSRREETDLELSDEVNRVIGQLVAKLAHISDLDQLGSVTIKTCDFDVRKRWDVEFTRIARENLTTFSALDEEVSNEEVRLTGCASDGDVNAIIRYHSALSQNQLRTALGPDAGEELHEILIKDKRKQVRNLKKEDGNWVRSLLEALKIAHPNMDVRNGATRAARPTRPPVAPIQPEPEPPIAEKQPPAGQPSPHSTTSQERKKKEKILKEIILEVIKEGEFVTADMLDEKIRRVNGRISGLPVNKLDPEAVKRIVDQQVQQKSGHLDHRLKQLEEKFDAFWKDQVSEARVQELIDSANLATEEYVANVVRVALSEDGAIIRAIDAETNDRKETISALSRRTWYMAVVLIGMFAINLGLAFGGIFLPRPSQEVTPPGQPTVVKTPDSPAVSTPPAVEFSTEPSEWRKKLEEIKARQAADREFNN